MVELELKQYENPSITPYAGSEQIRNLCGLAVNAGIKLSNYSGINLFSST